MIEKYPHIKFLLTSIKYVSLSAPVINIRFTSLSYFDFLKITLKINKCEKLNLNNLQIKNIIESTDNLHSLLNLIQLHKNKDNNINIIDDIINILKNKNIKDFNIIKAKLNILLISQIYTIENIINILFQNIIDHINDKHTFTYKYAELTNNLVVSNDVKPIILLDTIIMYIYKML